MLEEILLQLEQTEAACRKLVADAEARGLQSIESAEQSAKDVYTRLTAESHAEGERILQAAKEIITEEEQLVAQRNQAAREALHAAATPRYDAAVQYIIERLCENGDCRDA